MLRFGGKRCGGNFVRLRLWWKEGSVSAVEGHKLSPVWLASSITWSCIGFAKISNFASRTGFILFGMSEKYHILAFAITCKVVDKLFFEHSFLPEPCWPPFPHVAVKTPPFFS